MRNKMKRIMAVLMMSVMLIGGVMTAQAAEIQSSSCGHTPNYNKVETNIYTIISHHQYMTANGTMADCTVTERHSIIHYICPLCGADVHSEPRTVTTHSANHQ